LKENRKEFRIVGDSVQIERPVPVFSIDASTGVRGPAIVASL